MDGETPQHRSIFYPLGTLTALSVPALIFVLLGGAQLFMMPQGSGVPADEAFWRPLIPFGLIAFACLGIAVLSWRAKALRDVFLGVGILFGGGTLGFGMMMFALAERASIEDFVRATPVAPETNYTCGRQADGTIACLNALGDPDPNFSYTVTTREKLQP